MKAKKKRKNLEEKKKEEERKQEEEIEKNGEHDDQKKPSKAKQSRKTRFLARLQKLWARITGCMRRKRTSSQEERSSEDLPGPSNINMVDSTANVSPKEKQKEEVVEENQRIKADNKKTELLTESFVDQEILAEYQEIHDLIHSMEDLYIQYYGGQDGEQQNEGEPELENKVGDYGELMTESFVEQEILAEYKEIHDLIHSMEDLYIRYYGKSTTGHICLEEPDQSGQETSATVPLSLESFTFHKLLGIGGFGQVFLATDIIRKECVAIKVSDKRNFTEEGCSLTERHVLQRSHESPHLIHGLAAFHTINFVYYVMELATRGELFDFLTINFPLDAATIQFISAEVVCGTQFLHNKGILHRDLKLENILLTTDGHVKITDFGLAVQLEYLETEDEHVGTAGYAAPELVMDQAHGPGVDYFAIGVILYSLCTDECPFPGEDEKETEDSVLHHDPLYPESLTPDTVNILQGLLCKDQFQRLGVKGDIKNHPFFSNINWEDVEARRMAPPAILTAASIDLNINQTLDYTEMPNIINSEDQKIFNHFSFVCPEWSRHYHPVIFPDQILDGQTADQEVIQEERKRTA